MAVSLLEEPLPLERLARDPVQKVGVHLGSNRLQHVKGEAIPVSRIDVQDAQARIEAERSNSQSGLRLQNSVEIVEHCIRRVDRKPG